MSVIRHTHEVPGVCVWGGGGGGVAPMPESLSILHRWASRSLDRFHAPLNQKPWTALRFTSASKLKLLILVHLLNWSAQNKCDNIYKVNRFIAYETEWCLRLHWEINLTCYFKYKRYYEMKSTIHCQGYTEKIKDNFNFVYYLGIVKTWPRHYNIAQC